MLTVIGGIVGATGVIVAAVGSTPTMSDPDADTRAKARGLVMAGIGGAMLIPGVILWLTSGTSVRTSEGLSVARTPAPRKPASTFSPTLAPHAVVF